MSGEEILGKHEDLPINEVEEGQQLGHPPEGRKPIDLLGVSIEHSADSDDWGELLDITAEYKLAQVAVQGAKVRKYSRH